MLELKLSIPNPKQWVQMLWNPKDFDWFWVIYRFGGFGLLKSKQTFQWVGSNTLKSETPLFQDLGYETICGIKLQRSALASISSENEPLFHARLECTSTFKYSTFLGHLNLQLQKRMSIRNQDVWNWRYSFAKQNYKNLRDLIVSSYIHDLYQLEVHIRVSKRKLITYI